GAATRVEGQVQGAVRIQAANALAVGVAEIIEITGEQNLAVGLEEQGINVAVSAGARVERLINRAVGVAPGDVVARSAGHGRELAADEDVAIVLDSQRE